MIFFSRSLLRPSRIHLFFFPPLDIPNPSLRPGYGKAFVIKKLFDPQDKVHVFFPVKPLKRSSFIRFDDLKFRLPVTKDMRLEARNPTYLPDPIIEPFVGNGILVLQLSALRGERKLPAPRGFPVRYNSLIECPLPHLSRYQQDGVCGVLAGQASAGASFFVSDWLMADFNTWLGLKVKILLEVISMSCPV